jgi:predicted ATPase
MGDRAGLDEVGRGLALLSDAGTRSGTSHALATLAEAHHAVGDTQAALGTVEAALSISSEIGEPYWDAELMRLKAVFMLAAEPGTVVPAEALLRAALADATERGAAALALRVATTLGRLLAADGRGDDARSAVASALAAIEGGSETADVREAHQLIDSLSTTALEA